MEENKSSAATILGILSLIFWLIPIVGAVLGIIGLVLANQHNQSGARIMSQIGLGLSLINFGLGLTQNS